MDGLSSFPAPLRAGTGYGAEPYDTSLNIVKLYRTVVEKVVQNNVG
jgi:hypothetical protein